MGQQSQEAPGASIPSIAPGVAEGDGDPQREPGDARCSHRNTGVRVPAGIPIERLETCCRGSAQGAAAGHPAHSHPAPLPPHGAATSRHLGFLSRKGELSKTASIIEPGRGELDVSPLLMLLR